MSIAASPVAPVADLFFSVQGEGIYAGEKQVFVRFSGCNLECSYCDETAARRPEASVLMPREEIIAAVKKLADKNKPASVSLTGGEPLLHADFIASLAPEIKKLGLRIYLETNATLPGEFVKISGLVDVVSGDIKLPSATGRDLWFVYKKFYSIAPGKTFVKIVLDGASSRPECEKAVRLLASISPDIPLVWQPVTVSARDGIKPADPAFIVGMAGWSGRYLRDVRVLPQQHPLWGVK